MLDYVVDDLELFECLESLGVLPLERFKRHMEQAPGPHFSDKAGVWWKQLELYIPESKTL